MPRPDPRPRHSKPRWPSRSRARLFTLGRVNDGMRRSRPRILKPAAPGKSPPDDRSEPQNLRATIKELAQPDGAFVIDDAGIAMAACRHLGTSIKKRRSGVRGGEAATSPPHRSRRRRARPAFSSPNERSFAFISSGHLQAEVMGDPGALALEPAHFALARACPPGQLPRCRGAHCGIGRGTRMSLQGIPPPASVETTSTNH